MGGPGWIWTDTMPVTRMPGHEHWNLHIAAGVRAPGPGFDCLTSHPMHERGPMTVRKSEPETVASDAAFARRTAARHEIAGSAAGIAAALAAVVLFGATVVLQASLHRRGVAAMVAVGLRYVVSAVVCAAILAAGRRAVLPVPGERARAFLLGALVYAVQALLFYVALGHGTAGAVSMLFYTYPVMVLAIVLVRTRRRPTARISAAALASCSGAALLVGAGSSVVLDGTGAALALASSACAAGFLVANNTLLPRSASLGAAAMVSAGVATSTLLLAPFFGGAGTLEGWSWCLLIAAGTATGLGTAAMYTALASLGAPRTSAILAAQTAVAVTGSWWLLDDPVVLAQLVGGAFIFAAVVLSSRA
jgi:drug/metabolite transporter (DMT)-like permease